VPDEKFELKDFCEMMVTCGLTRDKLQKDIFTGFFGSPAGLSRYENYNKSISLDTLRNAQNRIGVFADRLADAFANHDTGENQYLQGNYAILVQCLKDAPLQNKLKIVEPGQLPEDFYERKKIYRTLFFDVLSETFAATVIKAASIKRSNKKTENNPPDAADTESPKKGDVSDIIDGISNLSSEETVQVFNALMEKLNGTSLDANEKEIMLKLANRTSVNNSKRLYMKKYKRTDEISISQDSSTMTNNVRQEFSLISDQIESLKYSLSRRRLYIGDITDIKDINTSNRQEDRRKIFEDVYSDLIVYINDKKVDKIFQHFRVVTEPRNFKNEQGNGDFLKTEIVLDELMQSYREKSVSVTVDSVRKNSPIMSNHLYTLNRIHYPVKKYAFTCVLSADTPKQWVLQLLPILPAKTFLRQNDLPRNKSIFIYDWVTPGHALLYVLEYTGPLEFKYDKDITQD
jgi:hypothetical protein